MRYFFLVLLALVCGCVGTMGGLGAPQVPEGAIVCGQIAGPAAQGSISWIVLPVAYTGTIAFGPDCHPTVTLNVGGK